MNPDEKSEERWKPVCPGHREALRRLFLITLVIFPLSWAINALLIGNWDLLDNRDAESWRHLIEWTVIWIAAVGAIFFVSLLPAFRRLFNRRNARRFFIALIFLVTLDALFYAEENWRGTRAWKKYRAQLEAGGTQLDFAAFVPKAVPDEQNFAATPVVQSWFVEVNKAVFTNTTERFVDNWRDSYAAAAAKIHAFESKKEKAHRQFADLAAWKAAFASSGETTVPDFEPGKLDVESRAAAAPAVLEGLKVNEAVFAQLRAASERTHSRYPVIYDAENPWGIFLPHLKNVRDAVQRLKLRACAKLALDRSDEALADVKLMLYLADTVKDEPFLISHAVRVVCVLNATEPVWEGLAEHAWSDAQLQELQAALQQSNFLPQLNRGLDAELTFGVLGPEMARKKGLGWLFAMLGWDSPTSTSGKFANWSSGFIPRGWTHLEQLNYCRLYRMQQEGAFDPAQKTISPGRVEANADAVQRELLAGSVARFPRVFLRHEFLASMMVPSVGNLIRRTATSQITADQAALACALERYRLANGNFPETLDVLAPRFVPQIPTDVLTGKLFNYRRTDDGQFLLYSVGWNEKDDGGAPGRRLFDEREGDWVWQYPAK